MSAQSDILRACTHSHKPCEVNMDKGEILNVCSECWNQSVYARLGERKSQLAAHWKQHREQQAEEMQKSGQNAGQRVSYFAASMLGIGGYLVTGTIKLNRNGVAVIKFDRPQNGKHSTEWSKGWSVIQ